MNWREKLEKFLNDFKYKDDVIGVLACGSYITGKPTSHSDLDVLFLKKTAIIDLEQPSLLMGF